MVQTKSQEFHGASIFGNNIDVSLTGARGDTDAYVLFDGLQLQGSQNENMYLDQQNETVICAANCTFQGMNQSGTVGGDSDSAIVIGPDATTTTGLTPAILSLRQGYFDPGPSVTDNSYYDIRFDQNSGGRTCNCAVTLAPDMLDLYGGAPPGTPSTNVTKNVVGATSYAPPLFGNGATAGKSLTVLPNEIGLGTSTSAITSAGSGLKLRVQCGTTLGTAKIVALAGGSTAPVTLFDNIGSGVPGCE